jgi:hypothetical protein
MKTGSLARTLALAAAAVLTGCGGSDLVLPGDAEPSKIELVSGDQQKGAAGAPLPGAIVVRVTDALERPVANQSVAFHVVSGGDGAQMIPDTARTDSDGKAQARWVLGRSTGTQRGEAVVVRSADLPRLSVAFTASAATGSGPSLIKESGDGQSGPAGSELPQPLVVRVTDQFGNPAAGISIAWTAIGGGSVSSSRVSTGSDGRASVRRTLGASTGSQSTLAVADALGGASAVFNHTATGGGGGGGGATTIQIVSGDNQSGAPGTTLPNPVVVRAVDGSGRGVAWLSVGWAVTGGGGSVSPTVGTTGSDGSASARWTLGGSPGTNTLTASLSGVGSVTFHAMAVVPAPRPARLSFVVQPSDTRRGKVISPPVQVAVLDADGRVVMSAPGQVTVAIGRNPAGGKLQGHLSQPVEDGIAEFSDLKIDKEGNGYTLVASYSGVPSVESAPFRITR